MLENLKQFAITKEEQVKILGKGGGGGNLGGEDHDPEAEISFALKRKEWKCGHEDGYNLALCYQ
ncbi:hypothetical protein TAMYLO_150016 [Tenacibaculum amylolyticum]